MCPDPIAEPKPSRAEPGLSPAELSRGPGAQSGLSQAGLSRGPGAEPRLSQSELS